MPVKTKKTPEKENCLFLVKLLSFLFSFGVNNRYWLVPLLLGLFFYFWAPTTLFMMTMAVIFYMIFYPVTAKIEHFVKSSRLAAVIFIGFLLILITVFSAILIPSLVSQVTELSNNYQEIEITFAGKLTLLKERTAFLQSGIFKTLNISIDKILADYLERWGKELVVFFNTILQSASKVIGRVFQVLIAFVVSLYMLYERRSIVDGINGLLKDKPSDSKEKKFIREAYLQAIAYFSGVTLLSLIGFITTWLFLAAINVNFSLLLAIWTFFMEYIPFFGPVLAAVPIIIIAWTQAPHLIIYIVLYFSILQFILAYILAPQILSQKTHFHPLLVLVILLAGGEIFGIPGMILSLPIAAFFVLLWKNYLKKV